MDHNRIQSIIFDFDYTLADSSPGVIECVSYALARLSLPAASEEMICRTIGLSLPNTLLVLCGPEHAHHSADFLRLFVERADEVMVDATALFETVPKVVRALEEHGVSLGIVSSKYRRRIEAVLEREGLRQHFNVIVGGDDVKALKPDPSGLLAGVERLKGTPAGTLYVGDSVTDAETARRAAVPFVAVLSGVTLRDEFAGHPALEVLESLSLLPALLGNGVL
jgi:phosphoglycolate phosphatase